MYPVDKEHGTGGLSFVKVYHFYSVDAKHYIFYRYALEIHIPCTNQANRYYDDVDKQLETLTNFTFDVKTLSNYFFISFVLHVVYLSFVGVVL